MGWLGGGKGLVPVLLVLAAILLAPVAGSARTVDTLPVPEGFQGPAPLCPCSAGGITQLFYHDPATGAARLAYSQGGDWQTARFPSLAESLEGHPSGVRCTSFVTDQGSVRTVATYTGRDKSGGFGLFTLVVDFPSGKSPEASQPIVHTLFADPGTDVVSASADYDTASGRIVAAAIAGSSLTCFNAGLDPADITAQALPDLSRSMTSADYPRARVEVSARPAGTTYLIVFDPGRDRIGYFSSLDGFATDTTMVSGTSIQYMTGCSGSGPATAQVEADIQDSGLWITWHDADGTKQSKKITAVHDNIGEISVGRRGDIIAVAWHDRETGFVMTDVVNVKTGEQVHLAPQDVQGREGLVVVQVVVSPTAFDEELSTVHLGITSKSGLFVDQDLVSFDQSRDGFQFLLGSCR